jgi:NAD(P)-dependent dehydrogenase (short-subunit alcohol dehydrogenase family)
MPDDVDDVTSSMGGRMGIPNIAHYNATKWGVIGMAKSLALEVAKEGITVNVVCPCTVATPMVLHEDLFRLFAPDMAEEISGQETIPDEVLERFRRVNPIPEPWLMPEQVRPLTSRAP